jgi:hypothetical protein
VEALTAMDPRFLPLFSGWLRTIGEDVLSLSNRLQSADTPGPFRLASAEALQYVLRSAELIPEGLEELGYLEVAFAFRVLAQRTIRDNPELVAGAPETRLVRLGEEADAIAEFLAEDMPLLTEASLAPAATTYRGVAAAALLDDDERLAEVLAEARAWAEAYQPPEPSEGAEELIKIRSFFRTRLRRAS